MRDAVTAKIDDQCRPGALKGLVSPGEHYQVERISDGELRFRLLVVANTARPRLEKRPYGTVLVSEKELTQEEVDYVLESAP